MNEQCPHLDYGKSADKALGAYCTAKKKLVEDCEGCETWQRMRWFIPKEMSEAFQNAASGVCNRLFGCEEGEEE
jgi:hypothetical protein